MGMLYEYSRREREIITGIPESPYYCAPCGTHHQGGYVCPKEAELTQKERMRDKHADSHPLNCEKLRELEEYGLGDDF